ncbi:MAG: hypothetical protein SFX19_09360 [Alphaproteobacteria bacterium]|nr:hypothetical protein [Alphaproteobacteria bacterium]
MAIHHCHQSLIERVEFHSPRKGLVHACIIPTPQMNAEDLTDLRGYLGSKGLSTLMDVHDGHNVIEVRGVKDDKTLVQLLREHGAITGETRIEGTPNDKAHETTLMGSIADNSLFLSALFYDLGNVAYLVSGYQRGRHNKGGKFTANDVSEMMIGAAFSVGDLAMTFCGGDLGNHELMAVQDALKTHLKEKGIEVPKGDALTPDSLYKSGAMQETYAWVQKNIVQIKCATESVAGLFTIHSSLKKGERNNFKLAGGIAITAGWFASFLTEKPTGHKILDGDEPPASLQEKISRNPRGWLARPAAMANNIGTILGAYKERGRYNNDFLSAQSAVSKSASAANLEALAFAQNKRHDYAWNVISSCSFLIANSLFGLSGSKRPTETDDDKTVMEDMVLLSANLLAGQPKEVRDLAVSEASDVVSRLSHVSLNSNELEKMIHDKIDSLNRSNWVARTQSTLQPPDMNIAQAAL